MGDSAKIYLRDTEDTSGMYLYTHDGAQCWPDRLQDALRFGKPRWDDPNYLSRIIATQVFADLVNSVLGGGLSTEMGDNDGYPLLCVVFPGQRVGLCDAQVCDDCSEWIVDPHDMSNWRYVVSFQEFCDLDLISDPWVGGAPVPIRH